MGFRGDLTKNTPLEVFPDMDRQAKFKSTTYNPRFADGSADRLPVKNTALRGSSLDLVNVFSAEPKFDTDAFKTGKSANGEWLAKVPEEVGYNLSTLHEGKENMISIVQYVMGIMAMVGVTSKFGLNPRKSFRSFQCSHLFGICLTLTDGQLYNAISNGSVSGIMLGLKDRLSPKERWSIVIVFTSTTKLCWYSNPSKERAGFMSDQSDKNIAKSNLSTKLVAGAVLGLGGGLVGLFQGQGQVGTTKHLFSAGYGVVPSGSA